MPQPQRVVLMVLLAVGGAVAWGSALQTQSLPAARAYRLDENWPQLPPELQAKLKKCHEGECDSQVNAVIAGNGGSVWMLTRFDPPIIQVDAAGKLLKAFGHGTFVQSHGFCMDRDGNLWAGDSGVTPAPQAGKPRKGQQVHKFSADGKLLLSLGKAGEPGVGPGMFIGPTACAIAANGDVLIADGHIPRYGFSEGDRIVRFTTEGKFVAEYGKTGSGPGEFRGIHAMAFDSRGHLLVADRSNNRIQRFDPQMKFMGEWKQLGRPSGLVILNGNTLVVSDWESGSDVNYPDTPGESLPGGGRRSTRNAVFMQGRRRPTTFGLHTNVVRVASAHDGVIATSFETSKAEGVGTDAKGNLYVGPWRYIPGR